MGDIQTTMAESRKSHPYILNSSKQVYDERINEYYLRLEVRTDSEDGGPSISTRPVRPTSGVIYFGEPCYSKISSMSAFEQEDYPEVGFAIESKLNWVGQTSERDL